MYVYDGLSIIAWNLSTTCTKRSLQAPKKAEPQKSCTIFFYVHVLRLYFYEHEILMCFTTFFFLLHANAQKTLIDSAFFCCRRCCCRRLLRCLVLCYFVCMCRVFFDIVVPLHFKCSLKHVTVSRLNFYFYFFSGM